MQLNLPLPSKGKVYDVPISDILVRTMKGGDEKLLAELTLDNIESRYLALLQNRVKNGDPIVKGIDPKKLTLGDRLFILLWERINSFSPTFDAELLCESCYQKIIITVDLTTLGVKELPDTFAEPFLLKLDNGDEIKLRLFRLEDEIKIVDQEKKKGSSEAYLYKLALSIVDDQDIPKRISYLEDLDSKDIAKIKAFHEEAVHGPELDNVEYTCPKCNQKGIATLPFRPDFLIPQGSEVV